MSDKKNDDLDYETTGHSWDGIKEYNKPLPKWWVWTFYACIVWGVGYVIAYPAWPLINGATPGLLGYSTRAEVQAEIDSVTQANVAINTKLAETDLTAISADADLANYAQNAGQAVYNTQCIQCHQANGKGAIGYPALLDDAWLWGGSIEDIYTTVSHGIRDETDEDARYSEMPAFGRDELLEKEEIVQLANFVRTLSGQEPNDATAVEAGKELFADNCTACHSEDGTGDRSQGAPNLTDAITLYGDSYEDLLETITNARFGVMPSWQDRLSEAQIRAVSYYVHSLGGGESSE